MKFKLKFFTILTACLLTAATIVPFPASAAIRGDVNGDGTISMADSILLSKYVAGMFAVSDLTPLDFDGNYLISQADADALVRFLLQM